MAWGVQAGGAAFILVMVYLTYLYYKKGAYSRTSALTWGFIWVTAIILLTVATPISGIVDSLQFARVIDLYLTLGLVFCLVVVFIDFVKIEKQERKLEELVRNIAIKRTKK